MRNYVHIIGFGGSGLSAIRDLFKEFDDVYVLEQELWINRINNGVYDLYYKLTGHSVFLMDRYLALEDFVNRIEKVYSIKYRGKITKPSYYIGKNFKLYLLEFISDLTIGFIQAKSFHSELNQPLE